MSTIHLDKVNNFLSRPFPTSIVLTHFFSPYHCTQHGYVHRKVVDFFAETPTRSRSRSRAATPTHTHANIVLLHATFLCHRKQIQFVCYAFAFAMPIVGFPTKRKLTEKNYVIFFDHYKNAKILSHLSFVMKKGSFFCC